MKEHLERKLGRVLLSHKGVLHVHVDRESFDKYPPIGRERRVAWTVTKGQGGSVSQGGSGIRHGKGLNFVYRSLGHIAMAGAIQKDAVPTGAPTTLDAFKRCSCDLQEGCTLPKWHRGLCSVPGTFSLPKRQKKAADRR